MCPSSRAATDAVLIPVARVVNSNWNQYGIQLLPVGQLEHGKYVFPSQMHARDQRDWACLIPPQKAVSRSQCTVCMDPGSCRPIVVLPRRGVQTWEFTSPRQLRQTAYLKTIMSLKEMLSYITSSVLTSVSRLSFRKLHEKRNRIIINTINLVWES